MNSINMKDSSSSNVEHDLVVVKEMETEQSEAVAYGRKDQFENFL
jgi:hypothetical protein